MIAKCKAKVQKYVLITWLICKDCAFFIFGGLSSQIKLKITLLASSMMRWYVEVRGVKYQFRNYFQD